MFVIKMSCSLSDDYEYIELTVDNYDASAPGGQRWDGGSNPTSEIIYSWPKFYWTRKSPKLRGFKVITAQLPFVWDTVNTNNNTFIYNAGVANTITVPVGYYTGAQMATQLQTLLSAITAGITVTYSSTTFAFTFTQTVFAGSWYLSFTSRDSMYKHLGFMVSPNFYQTSGAGSSITSNVYAEVGGPNYLYLNSRIFGNLINFNLCDGNPGRIVDTQIAKVPLTNVARGNAVLYADSSDGCFFDFNPKNDFEVFDLYWTLGSSQDETPLDLKGASWSVKLGFLAERESNLEVSKKRGIRSVS